jgi:hypothetical protein
MARLRAFFAATALHYACFTILSYAHRLAGHDTPRLT